MIENKLKELQEIVSLCNCSILYEALDDEINCFDNFPLKIFDKKIILPNDKNSDPFEYAGKCIRLFIGEKPYLLIPGQRFDLAGTRHGRGGGWYDRFLAKLPRDWLRIGIANASQLYSSLERKSHDQPVNWLLVQNGEIWQAYKTKNVC